MSQKTVHMETKDSEPVEINPRNCGRCHHSIEYGYKKIRCIHPNPKTRYEDDRWICRSFK